MNADQQAKFEAKAKARSYPLNRENGVYEYGYTRAAEGGWRDCLEANGVPELVEACELLLPIVIDAIMHGMPITPAIAEARNKTVAVLAKHKPNTPPRKEVEEQVQNMPVQALDLKTARKLFQEYFEDGYDFTIIRGSYIERDTVIAFDGFLAGMVCATREANGHVNLIKAALEEYERRNT